MANLVRVFIKEFCLLFPVLPKFRDYCFKHHPLLKP